MSELLQNRFVVGEKLGEGGMGVVYKGVDTHTNQTIAIKKLKKEAVERNPEQLERFRREAQALFYLNHPNMVKVIDGFQENGEYYIAMEFIEGGSLRDILKQAPKLPILYAVNIALDLSDALARAHRLKIIHRDIKPDNVLLSTQNVPYLTDFGQAHIDNAPGLTRPGQVIGTMNYIPPELLLGEKPNQQSDIWSFGVMLYEMISGFRPFMGETATQLITAILKQPVPDLQKLRPECPQRLADIVHWMLTKSREDRVFTVREVGVQLEYTLVELENATS